MSTIRCTSGRSQASSQASTLRHHDLHKATIAVVGEGDGGELLGHFPLHVREHGREQFGLVPEMVIERTAAYVGLVDDRPRCRPQRSPDRRRAAARQRSGQPGGGRTIGLGAAWHFHTVCL